MDQSPGGPRARTLRRLSTLVASAAVVGACKEQDQQGYNVVDPMPMPARCAGSSALFQGTVAMTAPGTYLVSIKAPAGRPDLALGKVSHVQGGQPAAFTPTPDGATLEIVGEPNAPAVSGGFELGCGAPPLGTLAFQITLADAGAPTLLLFDQ